MWALAWKFVTPAILISISVLSWVNHVPMKYGNYEFPAVVETLQACRLAASQTGEVEVTS